MPTTTITKQTDRNIQAISLRNFTGGLNLSTSPDYIADNEVQDCQNVLFDEEIGVVVKRKGYSVISTLPENLPIVRYYIYKKSDLSEYHIVQLSNGKVYYSQNLQNWTFLVSLTAVYPADFITFENYLWITNKYDRVMMWDGRNLWTLPAPNEPNEAWGTPYPDGESSTSLKPKVPKGRYFEIHQNRLFIANTSDLSDEIRFSRFYNDAGNSIKQYNASAWISINQLSVSPGDGTVGITGLKSFLGNLVVFKEQAIYVITGRAPDYSIIKIPSGIGCLYRWTITIFKNLLLFLGSDGIYSFNGNIITKLSDKIQPLLDRLQQILVKLSEWTQTTTSEFEEGTITNLATRGNAFNTLQLPTTKTIDNFVNQREESNNIVVETNKIYLEKEIVERSNKSVSYSDYNSDDIYNPPGAIDGNNATYFRAKKTGDVSGYDRVNHHLTFHINFPLSFVKYVDFYKVENEYSVQDNWEINSDASIYISFYLKGNRIKTNTYSGRSLSITERIYYDDYCDKIEIKFGFNGNPKQYWLTKHKIYSYFRIYEVYIKHEKYKNSGYFISRELDSGGLFNIWKNFNANYELSGQTITYEIGSYDVSGTSWNSIPSGQKQVISPNAIPTIPAKRFFRYKITLQSNDDLKTPYVYKLYQYFNSSGSWISKKQFLSAISMWRYFLADYIASGGHTVKFYIRVAEKETDLDNTAWEEVKNGESLFLKWENTNLGNKWIQLKVEMSSNNPDTTPIVNSVSVQYYTGGVPAGSILTWLTDTQTQWDEGTKTQVVSLDTGHLVLDRFAQNIPNNDFESDTNWIFEILVNDIGGASAGYSTEAAFSGTRSAKLRCGAGQPNARHFAIFLGNDVLFSTQVDTNDTTWQEFSSGDLSSKYGQDLVLRFELLTYNAENKKDHVVVKQSFVVGSSFTVKYKRGLDATYNWVYIDYIIGGMGNYLSSGNYVSKKYNVGDILGWGAIDWVAEIPTNTNLVAKIRSAETEAGLDTASWQTVSKGQSLAGVIPVSHHWIQYRLELSTTDATRTPKIDQVNITYYPVMIIQEAIAGTDNDRYYLFCAEYGKNYNNLIIVLDKNNTWTLFRGIDVSAVFSRSAVDIYAGSSKEGKLLWLFTGNNDDTLPIDAYFVTKNLSFMLANNLKRIRNLWIDADRNEDYQLDVSFCFDNEPETTKTIFITKDGVYTKRLPVSAGFYGKYFRLKFRNNKLNEQMWVKGAEIYYQVLPLRQIQ